MRDDERNLNPVLRAQNNRIRANERTLLSEFSQDHYTDAHPRLMVRDDGRYVEAHEFLSWLSQYLAAKTQSSIPFPNDLTRAVREATAASINHPTDPPSFESLTMALEGWFDRPMAELPGALRQRVEHEFSPMPWDQLSAGGRRSVALQLDYQHDPDTAEDRRFWWDFYQRLDVIKDKIVEWEKVATPSAADLALKESRLAELRQELVRMKAQENGVASEYRPAAKDIPEPELSSPAATTAIPFLYVAYPKAMHKLAERFKAAPEELAAWVFMGPEHGGIAAYLNANELDPPRRFHYESSIGSNTEDDSDYLAPLMATWFKEDDIARFDPGERYITGQALIERWSKHPGLQPAAYIHAKIVESRLVDLHPIYGGTRASFSDKAYFPPLTSGLFAESQIKSVETEDFAEVAQSGDISTERGHPASVDGTKVPSDTIKGALASPCAVFLAMKNLVASELSLAFVGDKSESGLGANNMLEIFARGTTKRAALAALDLVDLRRGTLNSQGVILLGMAQNHKLPRNDKNAKKMTRLREVFRRNFGVVGDPFEQYRKSAGWVPHFKISDNRGLADERARQDAERLTVSFDQLTEIGVQFTDPDESHSAFEHEDDAADEWLKNNDRNAPA